MNPMLLDKYSDGFHQKRASKATAEGKAIVIEEFLDIYRECVQQGWIKDKEES